MEKLKFELDELDTVYDHSEESLSYTVRAKDGKLYMVQYVHFNGEALEIHHWMKEVNDELLCRAEEGELTLRELLTSTELSDKVYITKGDLMTYRVEEMGLKEALDKYGSGLPNGDKYIK